MTFDPFVPNHRQIGQRQKGWRTWRLLSWLRSSEASRSVLWASNFGHQESVLQDQRPAFSSQESWPITEKILQHMYYQIVKQKVLSLVVVFSWPAVCRSLSEKNQHSDLRRSFFYYVVFKSYKYNRDNKCPKHFFMLRPWPNSRWDRLQLPSDHERDWSLFVMCIFYPSAPPPIQPFMFSF